jgi:hypothetical protein
MLQSVKLVFYYYIMKLTSKDKIINESIYEKIDKARKL